MKKLIARFKSTITSMSFHFKLMLSHISISLAIVILFGSIAIGYTFYTVHNNEKKTLNQLMAIITQDLNSRLEAYNNSSFNLVINNIIQQNLNRQINEQQDARQTIDNILRPVRLSDSCISNIMILDFKNNVYSTDATITLSSSFSLEDTSVYRQAIEGNGVLVWLTNNDIFDNYNSTDVMYQSRTNIHAAAIIKDYTTNQEKGILILSFHKNFFKNITYSGEVLQHTNLYLVSKDKSVLYPVSNTDMDFPQEILNTLDFSNEQNFSFNHSFAVDYQYNDAMNWYLVSITDNNTLYRVTHKLVWVMIGGIFACIFLSVILSRMFSRILYGGITEIKKGMEEVEKGNFEVVICTQRTDEFGDLIDRFNQMVRRIRKLIIEKYQQVLACREAEFNALQTQINPHFLYNTFDMLHWKLIERDQEDLGESVVSICKVLRYSVSNTTQNVTLEDELENINNYLYVLLSINEKKIEYSVNVVDEQKIMLPRLVLQPIVENCILHGFENRLQGNQLTINGFYITPEIYCIDIIDNGLGVKPDILKKINTDILKEDKISNHVGIRNVRLRVQYLYGKTSSVTISSQYGYGAHVRIQLPIQRRADINEDYSD